MSQVLIYQPAKSAMQSGRAKTRHWILEFVSGRSDYFIDSLMGWTGTNNNEPQVRLSFPSQEAALAYAQRYGYEVAEVSAPIVARPKPRSYSDNFRADRLR